MINKNSGCEVATENRINKQTFHSFEPIVLRSGGEWAVGRAIGPEAEIRAEQGRGDKKWANGGWDVPRADTNPSQH